MRKRAREESTTIPHIYSEALQDLSQCGNKSIVAAKMSTLSSLKSNFYREQWKRHPPMPQTRAEVTLAGDWANTLGGEPFILAEEGTDDEIILLGTQSNLHHLAEAECLWAFQTCPRLFYQIFSIHITKYGQTFPMVYALLLNKQQAISNHMFMMVKEAALNLGLKLSPLSVLSDFEQALNFPTAKYRGCYYHYSQAIWRKVQVSGLQEEYKAEDEILKSFVQDSSH